MTNDIDGTNTFGGYISAVVRVRPRLASLVGRRRVLLVGMRGHQRALVLLQSRCPGRLNSGSPTLQSVQKALKDDGPAGLLRFVPVQTVFECHVANAAEAAVESLARHGLDHLGVGRESGTPPRTMTDYRTGGTSWTVLVGPDRTVLVDGFHLDPDELLGRVFHHAEQHPPKETHA